MLDGDVGRMERVKSSQCCLGKDVLLYWTLDKSNPFRFEKAVIPDEPERISEPLKPPFSGETGV